MTADSAIEWTDHTFSPWLGCTPTSAACDHCYAAALARRYGWPDYRAGVPRRRTSPSSWAQVHRWQRKAAANGVRARVFPSLCDPFDGEVPIEWIDQFFSEAIEPTPDLDWLLLTKRPHLARKYFERRAGGPPPNVALGVTAETQQLADARIPRLASIWFPKLRFLSVEPMLGPIDLSRHLSAGAIQWVIAGGESGPNARPSHPDWFRALRDQCIAAGVAFFFKQWGEYVPCEQGRNGVDTFSVVASDGEHLTGERSITGKPGDDRAEIIAHVGKRRAGAELDGRHWRQLPPQLQAVPA